MLPSSPHLKLEPRNLTSLFSITFFDHFFSNHCFPIAVFFFFAIICLLRSSLFFRTLFPITPSNHSFQSVFELIRINIVFVWFWGRVVCCCSFFVCGFRLERFVFVFVILAFLWWCFCHVGCDLFCGVVVVGVSFCVAWLWCSLWWSVVCCVLSVNHICAPSLSSPET